MRGEWVPPNGGGVLFLFYMKLALKIFSYICFTVFLSSFLFISKEDCIDFEQYLFVATPIFLFFVAQYCICKSFRFFLAYIFIAVSNLGVFLYEKNKYYVLVWDATDICYMIYIGVLAVILIIAFCCLGRNKHNQNSDESNHNLFPERDYDLNKVMTYLNRFNIIGIDSPWGNGKSFLMSMLKKELKGYSFIRIGVVTSQVESIESFIINELSVVLEDHRIISRASSKLQTILRHSFFNDLSELVFEKKSYEKLIDDVKDELDRLKFPVLFFVEDADRIDSADVLYKIFAILEKLCENKKCVKVIYQYEQNALLNVLEKDEDYLEKYIPHVIHLTSIPLQRIVNVVLKDGKSKGEYKNISDNIFDFFRKSIYPKPYLSLRLGLSSMVSYDFPQYSIRKVKLFLEEIDLALEKDSLKKSESTVIVFFIVKHFMHNVYAKISDGDNLTDLKLLKRLLNGSKIEFLSLNEVVKKSDSGLLDRNSVKEIFSDPDNEEVVYMLNHLDYSFPKNNDVGSREERYEKWTNEPLKQVKDVDNDNKINHVIRYLYSQGQSSFSDNEKAVDEIKNKILSLPDTDGRKAELKSFIRRMNDGYGYGENESVQRIGLSPMLSLVKAFAIIVENVEDWISFVDLYFDCLEKKEISLAVVEEVKYLLNYQRSVFVRVAERFSQLRVVFNFNHYESMRNLVVECFDHFYKLGYAREPSDERLDMAVISEKIMKKHCSAIQNSLNEKIKLITDENLKKQNKILLDFINKIEELYSCTENYVDSPIISTTIEEPQSNDLTPEEIYTCMKKKSYTAEQMKQEVQQMALEEKITMNDVELLIGWIDYHNKMN